MANVNRLRVLPYVQTALAMPALNTLTARVEELFRIQTKMSFARIEQNLPEFKASEVRAATCVLIHRGTLGIDWTARLHDHAPIERKEDA
jgi:hypothetical protein